VNPRLTASVEVLERATQANLVAAHVAACRGGGSDLLGGATRAIRAARGERLHGKAIVYARGKVSAGERFASLVAAWTHGNERWIADIPNDGTVFSPGEPVATVFASASTTDEVVQQLRNAADEVHASLDA
jgi:predicted ATP-grasp superfamily ATP-dependent carboligase